MAHQLAETDTQASGHLRATFAVDPHPDAHCAVLASGSSGENVSQDIVCRDGSCESGCQCRSELTLSDGSSKTQFVKGAVHDRCICPVFRSHDCIATIERFESGTLEIELSVSDRSELTAIVTDLRATGATVRLERIRAKTDGPDERSTEIAVDGITDKQREAIVAAVDGGYYETPRRADLGDLADELGVSRSAASQRLSAVEANLITTLFERESGSVSDR